MTAKIERIDEGFEIYYAMGAERSLAKVGKSMQVAKKTVEKWSKQHYWVERIELRELRTSKQVARIAGSNPLKDKSVILKSVIGGIKNVIRTDAEGNSKIDLKVKDVYQFDRLVRLYLLLSGEPTDIKAVRHETIEMIVNHVVLTIGRHVKDGEVLSSIAKELREQNILKAVND